MCSDIDSLEKSGILEKTSFHALHITVGVQKIFPKPWVLNPKAKPRFSEYLRGLTDPRNLPETRGSNLTLMVILSFLFFIDALSCKIFVICVFG